MADAKTCFIIMPITTPDGLLEPYRDGVEHFKHVLECLFIPSCKRAEFAPVPPIAKGSDLIHAEIIRNLEKADLVLCDMSCMNPNVFFEFGIRTSLNKPVCVVKDDLTSKVPFDTGILNHHEYQSALEPWMLDSEIGKLAEHLKASAERSKGQNMLWKYFGMKAEAQAYQPGSGDADKIEYLALQMESLRRDIKGLIPQRERVKKLQTGDIGLDKVLQSARYYISLKAPHESPTLSVRRIGPNSFSICYSGSLDEEALEDVKEHVSSVARADVTIVTEPLLEDES